MVAQMSKAGKDVTAQRMDRNDIGGSASKSNKANVVILLRRDRLDTGEYSPIVHVQIDKNTMGATGGFDQVMQPEFFRLGDVYDAQGEIMPNIATYPGAAEALWCIERQALQCTRFAALLAYIRALQACQPPVYDTGTAQLRTKRTPGYRATCGVSIAQRWTRNRRSAMRTCRISDDALVASVAAATAAWQAAQPTAYYAEKHDYEQKGLHNRLLALVASGRLERQQRQAVWRHD